MQLNDISEWLGKHAAAYIVAAVALLVISIVTGLLLGTAARKKAGVEGRESVQSTEVPGESAHAPVGPAGGMPGLILPKPVLPSIEGGFSYSFYFDEDYYDIEEEEFIPVTVSGLLESRDTGDEEPVKPFRYRNKEYDVLAATGALPQPIPPKCREPTFWECA